MLGNNFVDSNNILVQFNKMHKICLVNKNFCLNSVSTGKEMKKQGFSLKVMKKIKFSEFVRKFKILKFVYFLKFEIITNSETKHFISSISNKNLFKNFKELNGSRTIMKLLLIHYLMNNFA